MGYHFKIHKEDSGYWAECLELEGCLTQGASLKELQANMKEALELYLDEPEAIRQELPKPMRHLKEAKNIIEI